MIGKSSSDLPGGDEPPSTIDQVRRIGPPAVIGLAAVLFVFQNTDSVQFTFLWFDFTTPLWVMLVAFAFVGAIVLFGLQRRRRSRKKGDES